MCWSSVKADCSVKSLGDTFNKSSMFNRIEGCGFIIIDIQYCFSYLLRKFIQRGKGYQQNPQKKFAPSLPGLFIK